MFNKNKSKEKGDNTSGSSILSGSVVLTGGITTETDLRIDGTINGNVDCQGLLVLGDQGDVTGNLKGKNVIIMGKLLGDVNVSERITLKSSSYVKGEIKARNIEIEPGAVFIGNCLMEQHEVFKEQDNT